MEKKKNCLWGGIGFLVLFLVWTAALKLIDVQAIGPRGSSVGFAAMNGWFHGLTGEHMEIYDLTDLLSVIPFITAAAFFVTGLLQWISRKSLARVDGDLIALGVYFVVVLGSFLLFEKVVINYRPVLIEGNLEASYPSSTTLLALSVMPAAMEQLARRMKQRAGKTVLLCVMGVFTAFMVIGRLISGVHWLSDILGGVYLSVALLLLYRYACGMVKAPDEK